MQRGASRDTIIEAARTEFGEHGYAGARIGRIAARAGLNKQLIYYYFGSKSGLHAAATAPTPPVTPPPRSPRAPAPDAVRAALSGLLSAMERRPELVSLAVDRGPSAEAASQARVWMSGVLTDLAAAVSQGQGMGYFRDDVDPASIARQAFVSCVGFLAVRRHLDVASDQWVREVADTLLRATAW